MMMDDSLPRSRWPLARIIETFPGEDGHVRKVRLAVGQYIYDRPIHKLVLLVSQGIPVKEPDAEE